MKNNRLSIKEFAHLTGIKTDTLRFYDKIGLLCPETRGTNRYRYYSRHQLDTAYIIGTLRGVGVGIEEIREFTANKSPEKTLELFNIHSKRIKKEIKKLEESKAVMKIHSHMIIEAFAHNYDKVFLEEKSPEHIFLCPPIPEGLSDEEGGIFSYNYAESMGINLGFPQGTLMEEKALKVAKIDMVERYYFKGTSDYNAQKPKGLYAIMYSSANLWQPEDAYKKILTFIHEENLEICGNAYEEYPLGDTTIQGENKHCLRIEIPVKKFN